MNTTTVKGVHLSALSLGTVQLGVNYGIANNSGKPDRQAAFDILNTALDRGITCLDTAAAYGDSEEIIGQWLKTIPHEKRPFIVTKAKHLDNTSLYSLRKSIRESVEASKAALGLPQLPMLMLHSCDEYLGCEENMQRVFEELKASGDILYSGISAYSYHDYRKIAVSGFDAVQVPLNIFDWGQIENGGIKALQDAGMMVFVRSVYLQGLVFRQPENLEPEMAFARETLLKFRRLCDKYGMQPAALAMSFALSLPGIHSLVLGSETAEQVQQNAALAEQTDRLSDAQMAEIRENFLCTDGRILNPALWFNAQS